VARLRIPPHNDSLRGLEGKDAYRILAAVDGPLVQGKYLHWDELVHRTPPEGLSHEEWWSALQLHRMGGREIPLFDRGGQGFRFVQTDSMLEALHRIDLQSGGRMATSATIGSPEYRDRYLVSSLIEEAISSSQMEGASTTREVASNMLRDGRKPTNRSERMIVNNFRAMQRIRELRDEALSQDLLFELHRIVTSDTLDDHTAAGRFRRADENVVVADADDNIYRPPVAGELPQRLEALCAFANAETPAYFIHPAVRSILLHFWLAFDHPFVDGNGRTARALFYWSMLHHGYWLFEFISISTILHRSRKKYDLAFLYTETGGNDLTYFVLHQLDVIAEATRSLERYIARKTQDVQHVERQLKDHDHLNHRQRALLSHALRHPRHRYTIASHRQSHNVTYETARRDLTELAATGLLVQSKVGKRFVFEASGALTEQLGAQGGQRAAERPVDG